ncbi:hypothetical protein [Prochlorococcus sp. MIT 1318]
MRSVSAIYLLELLSRWSVFSIAGRCCLPLVFSLIWLALMISWPSSSSEGGDHTA